MSEKKTADIADSADQRMIVGIEIEIEIEIGFASLWHHPPWFPITIVNLPTSRAEFCFPLDTDFDFDPDCFSLKRMRRATPPVRASACPTKALRPRGLSFILRRNP
jgi:hypothetical protein